MPNNGPKKDKRKRPTIAMQKQLLNEAESKCGWCKCWALSYDFHHIDEDPSHTVAENLIPLCGTCHDGVLRGMPSQADLTTRKRELSWNRKVGTYGANAKPEPIVKTTKFVAKNNTGTVQQAESITNHNYRGDKKPPTGPAPDSIGAHAAERSYFTYLREEYIKCRLLEQEHGESLKFRPVIASNIIKKVLKCAPLQAPITSFKNLWPRYRNLVAGTLGAQKFRRGFMPHDWEEHKQILLAGPDDLPKKRRAKGK